ncbi:unnamed protein product [Amoebophrya sp. A25]|nr:unnamed protein product [Amoebophrya sp. A25]|eukprot:GSA25T00013320001.1
MSGKFPKKISLGLAIMMTDVYQTPIIVAEGIYSEIKGFFSEMTRGRKELPFNTINPQSANTNKLGRPKQFNNAGFRFAGKY